MPSNSSLPKTSQLISSRMIAVLALIFVESMFFSALISAYFVIKRGRDIWSAAGAIHLPVAPAGFSSLIFVASGLLFLLSSIAIRKNKLQVARAHFLRGLILGALFLLFQLFLSYNLFQSGLTPNSSVFGGCYYLIWGAHFSQTLLGFFAFLRLYRLSATQDLHYLEARFHSLLAFWFFLVATWAVIYAELYLF